MISSTPEVPIKEFKQWVERETANVLQPFNGQSEKLIGKIKERLGDVREACEKLAEEASKELERGQAVRKAKVTEKLSKYFLKQIDKIAFPTRMSFSELDGLNRALGKTLFSIARERNVWFPRISPVFIITRKRFDFAFTRLAGAVSELGSFLASDYSKARVLESLLSETEEIMRLADDLEEQAQQKVSSEENIQSFQRKIEETEQNIESIRNSAALGGLAEANLAIQQLQGRVKYDLRHLQKPLTKFANMTRDPAYALTSVEAEKLTQYLENPFTALATEENGYPTLKGILKKVERAMDGGRLKLKSSRLRKAQEEVEELLNGNRLESLRQECARALSSSQQLVSSEEAKKAQTRLEELRRNLEELKRGKEAEVVRLDALEKEHEQLLEKTKEQKGKVEKLVFEVLGKRVSIKF